VKICHFRAIYFLEFSFLIHLQASIIIISYMKYRFVLPLLVIGFSSSAQVITSNIKEDPNFRTHSINWAMREKQITGR
jgi:hypothetical protein